jgi:hypothetical protein
VLSILFDDHLVLIQGPRQRQQQDVDRPPFLLCFRTASTFPLAMTEPVYLHCHCMWQIHAIFISMDVRLAFVPGVYASHETSSKTYNFEILVSVRGINVLEQCVHLLLPGIANHWHRMKCWVTPVTTGFIYIYFWSLLVIQFNKPKFSLVSHILLVALCIHLEYRER